METEAMENDKQALMMLGRIDGKLDGIVRRLDGIDQRMDRTDARLDRTDERLDGIDQRLRGEEKRSALFGAVAGGAVSVGTAIIVEGLRQVLRGTGGISLGN